MHAVHGALPINISFVNAVDHTWSYMHYSQLNFKTMKRIFTLLFATAMMATAFAQYGQKDQRGASRENDVYVYNDNHDYDKHDRDFRGAYVFTARERDMQIAHINREYDRKIYAVRDRHYMGWMQKKRIINNLEAQRDIEIRQVIHKFRSPKNKFGDQVRNNKKRW